VSVRGSFAPVQVNVRQQGRRQDSLLRWVADPWVYVDARRQAGAGSAVFLRIGAFTIDTPAAWLLGCVLLWIFFFPMHLVSRSGE
jgi:hypothetical protein